MDISKINIWIDSILTDDKSRLSIVNEGRLELLKNEVNKNAQFEKFIMKKNAEDKTFLIYCDETMSFIPLQQKDILAHIDASLDDMTNGEELTFEIIRHDMSKEEIKNLIII